MLRRAALLIALAVCVYCIHIKADIWPLVFTGDAIPNTANFRFIGVRQAVVNPSGTVAFLATFVDPATNLTGEGIFKIEGGQLKPVEMEGQPLPDVPGSAFGGAASEPSINSSGDIVFSVYTNEGPNSTAFRAIFVESGGVLRRVVDAGTPVLGAPGQSFNNFFVPVQINDLGQIAFAAGLSSPNPGPVGPVTDGIFMVSAGGLQPIVLNMAGSNRSADPGSLSLNNRGDIAFQSGGSCVGISVFSGGAIKCAVSVPQPIPNTSSTIQSTNSVSLSDNGDLAFISISLVTGGRGGTIGVPNAIVRWRQGTGTLEKIVAPGDPVPGVAGAVFGTNFLSAQVNPSGVLFWGETESTRTSNPFEVIGRYQSGQLSTVATENQYIDSTNQLTVPIFPNFDRQQGPIVTFVSGPGLYAASAAQPYTLRFPQIADGGGGAAGGWRTTFVLANRSATPANATISFYDDSGSPMNLAVGGLQQSQTSVVVPALGVAEVQTQGGGPLTTGWAFVQSDQNLSGIAIFALLDGSGNSTTEVGAPASLTFGSVSVFAESGANTSTGVALVNPNNIAANVTLTLKDSNSTPLTQTSLTIPPMGHIARYAGELFSAVPPGEFQGKIEILSNQPLAALTLRQRGSVFTSLPVIP
jgi:hypothetical protein